MQSIIIAGESGGKEELRLAVISLSVLCLFVWMVGGGKKRGCCLCMCFLGGKRSGWRDM